MKILDIPRSGSIGGTTSSHNRAGQYIRNRRSPVQPIGTGRRAFIRAAFGASSSAWAALTDSQRAAWTSYADSHPITDRLGQSIKLTGSQMFVSINTQLLNCGIGVSSTPPPDSAVGSPVLINFTVTHLGVITITLGGGGDGSGYILVAFSRPVSAGVSFNATYWQEMVLASDSLGGATFGTDYIPQFGLPTLGTKVFLKLTPVNQYGVTGTAVTAVAIAS